MSSIQLPDDIKILNFLQQPHTRYQVMKHLGNHYQSTIIRLDRLEKLGYVFVSDSRPWQRDKVLKFYLITASGRAMVRGYEEADRRE